MTTEGEGPTRVLICEDHRILADALASLISAGGRGTLVCPPVQTGDDAVAAAIAHTPDVVVMDINLPGGMTGLEATKAIKDASPESKVVVITSYEEGEFLVPAVEAGASALLEKSSPLDDVLDAIDRVASGDMLIDSAKLARMMRVMSKEREGRREADLLLDQLTERETEILQLSAEGLSTVEVAEKLVISPQTVQTHVRNVLAKLGARSKLQAVAFAAKHGRISLT